MTGAQSAFRVVRTTRKKRGRPPVGRRAMTNAERCRRYRKAKRARLRQSDEWCTPLREIELAREAMGGIDCDPAANAFSQTRINAPLYFTKESDGLLESHDWHGRVFLNPPYSRGLIDRFVAKLLAEIEAGRVTQAILLVHGRTDAAWFHLASSASAARCEVRKRIRFEKNGVKAKSPETGSVFFYFGQNVERFREVFGAIGAVHVNPSRAQ
jgi:hypothetical protein